MSKCRIILLPGSLVWMTDGVETERIPFKPEYNIINEYVDVYDTIWQGKDVKAFDPFVGLSDTCNFAMCSGLSEDQVCKNLFIGELHIPDITRRLVHVLMNIHGDFYDEYCRQAEATENRLGI